MSTKNCIQRYSMVLLTVCLVLLVCPAAGHAQKALKPIKTALKEKKYSDAVKQIAELRKDSLYRNDEKLCEYAIEAQRGLNDAQNTKLYLKQPYDTAAFFNTTYQIIAEAVRLDSIEQAALDNEGTKPRQQRLVQDMLRTYFKNLNAGARYFYRQGKYAQAMPLLREAVGVMLSPLGERTLPSEQRSPALVSKQAALYLSAAYRTQCWDEVHRYEVQAMLDSSLRDHLLECLAFTAEARKDTAQYLHYLTQAWEDYPTRQPFFLRLTDYYLQQHDYAHVLTLCDRQLEVDTLRTAAYVARCNALLNLRRFDEVVATAEQLQQCDTLCAEAYYYMGTADAALGAMVTLPKDARSAAYKQAHKKQQTYYRKAMESIEEYRRRMPDDKARWAPLLYQLYLWLNEGKKFEEVERLLQ